MNGPLSEAEYEQLRADLEQSHTDRAPYVIGYTAAAVGGGLFTAACLVIGAWVGGVFG